MIVKSRQIAFRIALIYALVSATWIALSDWALERVFSDAARLMWLQTLKGWFFVGATAVLLYWMLRRTLQRAERWVAERARAEEALQHSEAKFRRLIENASDVISLIDAEGIIRFQSPSTPRVSGYNPEELVGRQAMAFIHPDDQAQVAEAMRQALTEDERPIALEFRICHRNGSWRTLQALGKGISEPDGARMMVVNARDITDSRTIEAHLRQSQKMEAIGQLSGGVAHDFNNLLTVIKGHIGLLIVRGRVPTEIKESIQQIGEAADRAAKLTRQLLTFSRQQEMEPVHLNLNGIVTNLAKMLRRLLTESIDMKVECAPQPLPVLADEGMIEQVLLNLVVNARDAMPKSGTVVIATSVVTIDFTAARRLGRERIGTFACVAVSDTGTGIAPEILPRIFEPFFTTKESGRGTGLGLATVYGIVQQHSGWVDVESVVGRGTTFRVYLPLLAAPAQQELAPTTGTEVRSGHEGILLVEDEASVREMAEVALASFGYRVFAAPTGRDALQVWQAHRDQIDLLVTDLVMPAGINGRDLAVRLQEENPRLPVVYMSGYSYDLADEGFKLDEGRNYLAKPFDVSRLTKIVRQNLDRSGSASPFAN